MIVLNSENYDLVAIAGEDISAIATKGTWIYGYGYRTMTEITLKSGKTVVVKENPKSVLDAWKEDLEGMKK